MSPIPKPKFPYTADEIFEHIFTRFWLEQPHKSPEITLTGTYDKVIGSQEAHDKHFNDVVISNFSKWWETLSDKNKHDYAKETITKILKPSFELQLPPELSEEICIKPHPRVKNV